MGEVFRLLFSTTLRSFVTRVARSSALFYETSFVNSIGKQMCVSFI